MDIQNVFIVLIIVIRSRASPIFARESTVSGDEFKLYDDTSVSDDSIEKSILDKCKEAFFRFDLLVEEVKHKLIAIEPYNEIIFAKKVQTIRKAIDTYQHVKSILIKRRNEVKHSVDKPIGNKKDLTIYMMAVKGVLDAAQQLVLQRRRTLK